jgi:hypothetical protein
MTRFSRLVRNIGLLLLVAAIIDQIRRPADERTWTGNILVFPYDFRIPTAARIQQRWWNPDDERIFTPDVFGVGWSVNLFQLLKRFGVLS